MKRRILSICVCLALLFSVSVTYRMDAKMTNSAVKFLKGKWYSASCGEGGSNWYVKFTKKYAKKYTYNSEKKKYVYSGKGVIKSVKKISSGYRIKIKDGKTKYTYQSAKKDKNKLEYYGTWNVSEFSNTYSGSYSLSRTKKQKQIKILSDSKLVEKLGNFEMSGVDLTAKYIEYIHTLKVKKYPSGIYGVIVDAGMPVLLITDSVVEYSEDKPYSAHASLYAYNFKQNKVEYIGIIDSTGSGYPLLISDGYVIGGFHHSSKRLTVKDGIGELDVIDNLFLDKNELIHKVYSVSDGKKTKTLTEKIPVTDSESEEKYDYYSQALINEDGSYNEDKYVCFEKLTRTA